jgi:hypothetical protein
MPWVRFDDQFPIHRKTAGLSDAAFRLHVSAIFWCARNLTDGFVSKDDLDDVCARVRTPIRFAAELVIRRLWHLGDETCPSDRCVAPHNGDGWVIHDYLEYQPSAERVHADRLDNARRQQEWRERQAERRNAVSNGVSNEGSNGVPSRPVPELQELGSAQRNGVTNGAAHEPPAQTPAANAPKPPRRKGTRLPDDFRVTPEMRAWFDTNISEHVDGKRETEKFRNYWTAKTGQAATKLDWEATWRNWMLKASEYR